MVDGEEQDRVVREGAAPRVFAVPLDDLLPPDRWAALRLTSRGALVFTLFFAIFAMAVGPIVDVDYWWHMKTGQLILDQRAIPRVDLWSHTLAGHEWVTDEWLTEVFMYGLFRLWGSSGQILVFGAIAVLTWAPVYATCRDYGGSHVSASLATAIGAVSSAFLWNVRPIMVALLLFSWWLRALFLYRMRILDVAWIFPLLTVVWVNAHGSFVLGLGVLVLVGITEALKYRLHPFAQAQMTLPRLKRYWKMVPVCFLATLINAHLQRAWTYPLETVTSVAQRSNILDWLSPNFHLLDMKFFEAMLFLAIVCLVLTRRRVDWTDGSLFLVFAYMSLESWRHIPYFAIALAPMLVRYLPLKRSKPIPPSRLPLSRAAVNWAVVALVAAFLLSFRIVGPVREALAQPLRAPQMPEGTVAFLREHRLPGNLFNNQPWGGYVIWNLAPKYRVFIDGRSGMYGDEMIVEYQKLMQLKPDWEEPLRRFDINVTLLPRDAPADMFLQRAGWKRVHADNLASILVRDTPQNADLIRQLGAG